MIILPYKSSSKSARALADGLGCKLMKKQGSKYKGNLIINWGNSQWPTIDFNFKDIINSPACVEDATDKLKTFKLFSIFKVPHVPFTESKEEAKKWIAEGSKVVCRTILTGHSGRGIVLASKTEELVDAPLYTKYIPKSKEVRVHSGLSTSGMTITIDYTQKKKRQGVEVNKQIRSHNNGWVFCREGVELDPLACNLADHAVQALSLDFGAVDMIYSKKLDKWFVLEVNSAPGLEGTTLQRYISFFKNHV